MSYRKHHKHSYQLIMHAERLGLSARDRALVALISRYHRRTGPETQAPGVRRPVLRRSGSRAPGERAPPGRRRSRPRPHRGGRVADDELTPKELVIRIAPRMAGADLGLECWGASRKADVLAKLLRRDVVVTSEV